MRFRPCIDLHQGKVKQIVGSTLRDDGEAGLITNFQTDASPASFASMYRRDGLRGGHVIMLGPGNREAAITALQAFPGGLQVGGGITPQSARPYLDAGASHVIITSYVFRDGRADRERLTEACRAIGRSRLVLDLSCRKKGGRYFVVTDRWQKFSDLSITKDSLGDLSAFCDEFLVHAADVEGMRLGIDEELVTLLGDCSPIPATYAGGIRNLGDLAAVKTAGRDRVDATIGSALDIFGGDLRYDDVLRWMGR